MKGKQSWNGGRVRNSGMGIKIKRGGLVAGTETAVPHSRCRSQTLHAGAFRQRIPMQLALTFCRPGLVHGLSSPALLLDLQSCPVLGHGRGCSQCTTHSRTHNLQLPSAAAGDGPCSPNERQPRGDFILTAQTHGTHLCFTSKDSLKTGPGETRLQYPQLWERQSE